MKRPLANEAQLLADLVARQTAHLAYLDSRKDVRLRATQASRLVHSPCALSMCTGNYD